MPFKSKAQRRKFAALLVEGKIRPETFEEWNRETGSKCLPERVPSAKKPASRKEKPAPSTKKTASKKAVSRKKVATSKKKRQVAGRSAR